MSEHLSLPLSARVSRGCCRRRHGDAEVPTYLVEAKEAQLPHHIQGTDPGPCGDLSSHLQTDFNDLQRIGENHLGSSSLQEAQGNLNMDRMQVSELKWDELWSFGDVEAFLHSSFPIILINFNTKDAFFPLRVRKKNGFDGRRKKSSHWEKNN